MLNKETPQSAKRLPEIAHGLDEWESEPVIRRSPLAEKATRQLNRLASRLIAHPEYNLKIEIKGDSARGEA